MKLCDCLFPSLCYQRKEEKVFRVFYERFSACRIKEGLMKDDEDLFQWASKVSRKLNEEDKE